jgi:hypothetical protein
MLRECHFFEWREVEVAGKAKPAKMSFYITRKDGLPLDQGEPTSSLESDGPSSPKALQRLRAGESGVGRVSRVKAGPHGFTQLYRR